MILAVCILLKNLALFFYMAHETDEKKNPLFLVAIAASSKGINNLSEEQLSTKIQKTDKTQ